MQNNQTNFGALWNGSPQYATLKQLLSTATGLANTGDSNFDAATISTLYVSTITGLNNGTEPINILNTSSIQISTFKNININGSNVTLRSQNVGQFINNGIMLLNNTDPVSGRSAANITNILTGEGSFQALAGNLQLTGSDQLNLYAGNKVLLETAWSQNNLPDGIFDIAGNNLIGVRSLSTINVSTGTIRASDIRANSLSSIYVSTGSVRASDIRANSLSSIYVSTGLLKAGATTVDTLNAGATTMSGNLDMNGNSISAANVITTNTLSASLVGATSGNFTNLSGTLSGNVSGNLTGNVTGNIYNTNLTVGGKYSITETADVGSAILDYASYGTVNIAGKGGLGGIVNITADVATPLNPAFTVSQMTLESKGNYGNFFITPPEPYLGYFPRGGLVQIIARQGLTPSPPAVVTSALAANGEIDLTAYSYGTVPGLIKMSAGANAMYAGAFTPITGIFGNNYIAATVANTIVAGLPPGGVPTFPGTNYLYGYNGTSVQNGLYVDNILNYGNGVTYSNLTIGATNSKDVIITNVKTLNMQNTPTIDGAGTGSINSFSNINGSNLNISKEGYISSLTVDDIIWTNRSENFNTLYTSTLFTSTITGFNNGTQTLNMLNTSSINISSGRQVILSASNVGALVQNAFQVYGSNILFTASNTFLVDNRGATQGKVDLLASTLSLYSQNNTLVSANTDDLTLYAGRSTIIHAANSVFLETPLVNVQTHIDTPSISTLNFQATNFLATTTTVANETVAGTLTAPIISTTTINNIGTGVPITVNAPSLNTTTINVTTGNIGTINATTITGSASVNTPNVNTTTTTLQNIKGNPDLSISTGTLLLQTTINAPVVITTSFAYTGSQQTWLCPAGVVSIQVSLSGAGGGTNTTGTYSTPGAGGLVSGTLAVTPGQTYNIIVGQGGGTLPSSGRYGSGGAGGAGTASCDGGGYTAIFAPNGSTILALAGGGGGAAQINTTSDNYGGAGGGLTGQMGGGQDRGAPLATGGGGGTQSAPGAGGAGNQSGNPGVGGVGGVPQTGCGAGGGGFFGGGGGSWNAPAGADTYGGGGGGSSYVAVLTGTVVNTQGGGAAAQRNGSMTISYSTTAVAPNCIFDAYVDVANKLTFNTKSIVCWQQGMNVSNNGQEWDSGWQTATDPASGLTFSSSQYVMTTALTYASISQPYAIAWTQISQQTSGGIWQFQGKTGSATASGTNLKAYWSVQITMIPIELCPGGIVSEVPPAPTYVDTPLNNPNLYLSSVTAALLTFKASENIAIVANLSTPTFLGNGTVAINGDKNVDLMANIDITLGAAHDINATATHAISLTASNIDFHGGGVGVGGTLYLNNHNIESVASLYFSNSAYIDCVYSNQFNFHANNSYYFGSLRFYGSGLTLDIADNIIQNVATIYGSTGGYLTLNANNAMVIENNQGARQALNSDGSFEFRTTGANKTVYINAEAMTFTGGSNNRINDLGHIYGNTSAPGGGLAIDYMYGLFFNSAGNNANLYASGGSLHMTSYNGGTYIENYNASGTGNLSLYSASNDVILATGAGHNIAINSGSNIYLNAAGSDGLVAVYASTMNTQTLQDTNITANRYMTLSAASNLDLRANYTTITGSNNFNILASNAGITASNTLGITTGTLYLDGAFSRKLNGTQVVQPYVQYGTATGSGASGSVNVSLPVAYTSATSYIVTASMMDVDPARISVNRNSASNITIYWFQAGSGTQTLGWNTMGT